MAKNKIMFSLILAAIGALTLIGPANSQDSRPSRGQGGQGGQGGGHQISPDEIRQRMSDRMKEYLGATDEEWKVLEPRVEKVMKLSMESRGMGMGMRMGGWNRDRAPEAANEEKQSDVQQAGADLRKVLENKDAKPEEISKAVTALREARSKVKAELVKAQKELQEVVTVRQEAQLVVFNLLD